MTALAATRAVSVLEVVDELVWDELSARIPLEEHLGEWLGPLRRVVLPSFETLVGELPVLVRYARRAPAPAVVAALGEAVEALPRRTKRLLQAARHHAVEGVVIGAHAWDPVEDADAVRILHGAGLIEALEEPIVGRYRLNPDLPPPEPVPYGFEDAVMPAPDDLPPDEPGALALLHDLASLAAAIEQVRPKRTLTGTLARADQRRISARLAADADDPRWTRAMRGLEALGVVSTDPIARDLHLDLGLEATLAGDAPDAVDQLVRRLVESDLHGVIPAVREALRQAGGGAVDEVVFFECLREQHRDLLFPSWARDGGEWYPILADETPRPYDDEGWERLEQPMIGKLLARLQRLGVLRRAPGVFAATTDGRAWARAMAFAPPPVWVTGDLELVVPPGGVTPWERFQLERLGRCLQRDVVDRYRLERKGLERWLATHEVDEALDLLRRRCPGVPVSVEETLRDWARSVSRAVLIRGVLLP